jgi:hypothetical protein
MTDNKKSDGETIQICNDYLSALIALSIDDGASNGQPKDGEYRFIDWVIGTVVVMALYYKAGLFN